MAKKIFFSALCLIFLLFVFLILFDFSSKNSKKNLPETSEKKIIGAKEKTEKSGVNLKETEPKTDRSNSFSDPSDSEPKSETNKTKPASTDNLQGAIVKKSKSGICHDLDSRWYEHTQNYIPYPDIQSCLDSGGRLPK